MRKYYYIYNTVYFYVDDTVVVVVVGAIPFQYLFFFISARSLYQHILYYFGENMAACGLCIDLVFLIKSIIAYYSNFEMGACEMNQK